ncbi:hypothetical protein [Bremerella cremea]|uniref:hypothetical protein n=1 Tax=Bremerella cremea TaxID=1031537 RepID=UPI0031E561C5
MRLSVLQFALVLGAFALPATAMSQEGMPMPQYVMQQQAMQQQAMQQQAMMPQAAGQSVLVNHEAAMPQGYGQAYCPPGQGHHGMFQHHHQSNLPGYAQPNYGGNPNFGAMNYPPQQAPAVWPYTGSYYPYPQIPPGWKKVALEWDDGYWYLDFMSNKKAKHH